MPNPAPIIGYCTNVHAGTDLASIRENLIRYAVPVRDAVLQDSEQGQTLGVGLWIPNDASEQLVQSGLDDFAAFLKSQRLTAFTINGFPYDNFHRKVVKHDVYSPPWWTTQRLHYTQRLAAILAAILPSSQTVGSISTLPIGWRGVRRDGSGPDKSQLEQAAIHLRAMAVSLAKIEQQTGRRIVLAIEPEPGCVLDRTSDCIEWFDRHVPDQHRRYLTVCHDICHAAVMMEDQRDVLHSLARAGIGVGKVQISSAIQIPWESMAIGRRREAIDQLKHFAEDRYLHQVGRRRADGGFTLEEDLPGLLASLSHQGDPVDDDSSWVIHFHVPVFLERFGHLATTRNDVIVALRTLLSPRTPVDFTGHLEIETYAWTVLPEAMRRRGLAEDIAGEFEFVRSHVR